MATFWDLYEYLASDIRLLRSCDKTFGLHQSYSKYSNKYVRQLPAYTYIDRTYASDSAERFE